MNNIINAISQLLIQSEIEKLGIPTEKKRDDFTQNLSTSNSLSIGNIRHYFMINPTPTNTKKLLENNVITLDSTHYFLDENDEFQIADYDQETDTYYYNGYELDTNEFPILKNYFINPRFFKEAEQIFQLIPESSLAKTGYFYINKEMYKFQPIVAQLYQALTEKPDDLKKALTTCYNKDETIDMIKQYGKRSSMLNFFADKDEVKEDENAWLNTLNIK